MSTATPDLELRKAMALKLRWTEIECLTDRDGEKYLLGLRVGAVYKELVPPYELSMDALLRDAVPWAKEQGWVHLELATSPCNHARFCGNGAYLKYHRADTPAKAFCRAFLKLP